MRALVVDDSRTMRTILGRIVTGLGFEVAQAGDGEQALTALDAASDVILGKLRLLGVAEA
jgi:two-component system chemotaxis response regulator CheY